MQRHPSSDRCLSSWWCWCRLTLLLALGATPTVAQPSPGPRENRARQYRVAATKDVLWLAAEAISPSDSHPQSRIFFRTAGGGFDPGRSTGDRIEALTVLDRELLVFFDGGGVYRYFPDPLQRPTAEAVLPQSTIPLDAIGHSAARLEKRRVYAIIPSQAAAELPIADPERGIPTSRPFDPNAAPLSLVVYDGQAWAALTALPRAVRPPGDARLRPQLGLTPEGLWLLAPADQPNRILVYCYDPERRRWAEHPSYDGQDLKSFWAVTFTDRLTLVTITAAAVNGETVHAYRYLDAATTGDATDSTWTPAELQLSSLPDDAHIDRYADAFGFNQHIGLLAIGANDQAYLRFAYLGAPVEPTVVVESLLDAPALSQRADSVLQKVSLLLLLGVLTGLFVFRRGSMVNLVELPPGCALALNMQRLIAWLIDFTPFSVAVAVALEIPWNEGLRSLAKWGIVPDPQDGLPDPAILVWWCSSVVVHTTYTLVMELLTRRTAGKVIARIRLVSESGTRPTAGQILTRNLTRLIELMPQFWVFAVLVLLSRNRQRLGDIFARTVVVRRVPLAPRQIRPGKAARSGKEAPESTDDEDSDEPRITGNDEHHPPDQRGE